MKKDDAISLYKKYHIDRNDERLGQFLILENKFKIKSALYPGSFVHITPSLVFPKVVYVDNNKHTRDFFNNPAIYDFVSKKKLYSEKPVIYFYYEDYRKDIKESLESFDLLISQYAGFISQFCKKYLKVGSTLLANNSHGDASMASIDKSYKLISVLNKQRNKYTISEKNLDSYFIPKKTREITKKYLEKTMKGVGYTKSPTAYLFKRIK